MNDARAAVSRELAAELRELGMREVDIDLYVRLVALGAVRVEEVPVRVRRRLVAAGLAGERDGGTTLYASDPRSSWTSKAAQAVWTQAGKIGPIHNLDTTGVSRVDHLRERCERVSQLADALFVRQGGLPAQHRSATSDPNVLALLTAEAILTAKREIVAVSRTPRLPHVALIWQAITDRMEAGVSYRRLTDFAELLEHGLAIVRRDIYDVGVRLRVLERERYSGSWFIIDRKYLVVQDDLPLAADWRSIGGAVTTEHARVLRYASRFDKLWQEAVDARTVVSLLQREADQLLEISRSAAPNVLPWVRDIIRAGKFTNHASQQEWSPAMVSDLVQRAQQLRVLTTTSDGHVVPAYPSGESVIEAARAGADIAAEEPCPVCWEESRHCQGHPEAAPSGSGTSRSTTS
ncbi:hypothetical protein AB0F68_06950 [Micromonospora sp. NPDC023966]|uniref:hypothetical protein n=1 Tax=Micromonospora sp. NPDC023966 TaxID=3154699 RepID=UPI0033C7E293